MTPSLSEAGGGLGSIPCKACGAGAHGWCQKRRHKFADQHRERWDRWDRWRAAGRPVIGPDGAMVVDEDQAVAS